MKVAENNKILNEAKQINAKYDAEIAALEAQEAQEAKEEETDETEDTPQTTRQIGDEVHTFEGDKTVKIEKRNSDGSLTQTWPAKET